jgi:predicted ATPase/DNA-binding SARP family transcriptional activator
MSLDITTFGGLRVAIDHEPLGSLRSRSAEALLVYLVCQGRPLPREWLAEFFWPERPSEVSQGNLRVALHRLQKRLAPYLTVTRQTVGLREENLPYLDSADFERLLAGKQLAEALNLYRGDFLEGFYLENSPAFETWVASERERLRDMAVAAYQEFISKHVARGQGDTAIRLARRLLQLEPFHEPTQRVLLRLLAQMGRRQAALEHFESYRKLLGDELGLEPESATLALLEEIRSGEGLEPTAHVAATSPVPTYNFPLATPLFGRQVELEGLASRLTNPDCRLVTLTGPGGIGKTRLAIQAALDLSQGFTDGVAFVPLVGVTLPDFILPAIIQSLELTPPAAAEPRAWLFDYLRQKRMLLVLDNFEHLLEGAALLAQLLRHAPGVKLLVTSRERLSLFEEWLLPLAGLEVNEAAVALFVERAKRVAPGFDLVGQEEAVRAICRLVEGFPLAIELAASWAGTMSCDEIVQEIGSSLDFLSTRLRDVPERHRSVRGLFDHSWDLLTPEEGAVFMRLSVFRGGFTVTEARRVAEASLDALRALVEKSLVRSDGRGRFELHELIRQYAAERLDAAGEEEVTARRHFEAYLALAEEADPQLFGREQPKWLKRLEAEWDNFRVALLFGFGGGQGTNAPARLVLALTWFWRRRTVHEAREWLERALGLEGLTTFHRAALLYHAGHVAWMQGAWEVAKSELEASLALWAELGLDDGYYAARTRCSLAMTRYMQRRAREARKLLESALVTFERENDDWWTSFTHGWQGKIALTLGEHGTARRELHACLDGYRRQGNRWGLALFLGTTAQLHFETGDLPGARALAEEACALLVEVGHKHALGEAQRMLGEISWVEGRRAEAEAHYRRSLATYKEIGQESFAREVAAEWAALGQEAAKRG